MIGDRIREIRATLGLNQADFGKRLNLSQSAVANYEKNVRVPIDAVILSICREFGVREEWLRNGSGDPFVKLSRDAEIEGFVSDILKEKPEAFRRRFVSAMAALSIEEWEMIERILKELFDGREEVEQVAPSAAEPSPSGLSPDEQELIRQYREKKNQAGRSSASAAG